MDLEDFRKNIDEIDDKILDLFLERMEISAQVASYKKENKMEVLDKKREGEKLEGIRVKAGSKMESYATELYEKIFSLSRDYQDKILKG